jgi:hypothetical protein
VARRWLEIVSQFSLLRIMYPTDRMLAFHGFTDYFSRENNLGSYFAGIWQFDLARGLLFDECEMVKAESTSSKINHAKSSVYGDLRPPSWSWTSTVLDGSCYITWGSVTDLFGMKEDPHFSVQEISCIPFSSNNSFGWATNGVLKVKGRVKQVQVQPSGGHYRIVTIPISGTSPSLFF